MHEILEKTKSAYYISYYWSIASSGFLGFSWLFFEINKGIRFSWVNHTVIESFLYFLILVAIVILLMTPLVLLVEHLATSRKRAVRKRRKGLISNYIVDFANIEELELVVNFGHTLVGDNHIDLETLKRRYHVNQQIVTCLFERLPENKKGRIIGYYILYPLNENAYNEIHNLKIINGRDIRDEHIASSFQKASALYIGMAGGEGLHAAAYVLEEMIKQISPILNSETLKAVCTRGATDDGKRAAKDFGFQPLSSPSEVSCIFVSDELLSEKRIKRHLAYR